MLSRNNWKEQVRQQEPKKQRFTIKKLTIGVASVLIGFTFMGMSASANGQTTPTTGTPAGTNQNASPSMEEQSNNNANPSVQPAQSGTDSKAITADNGQPSNAQNKQSNNSANPSVQPAQSGTDSKAITADSGQPNNAQNKQSNVDLSLWKWQTADSTKGYNGIKLTGYTGDVDDTATIYVPNNVDFIKAGKIKAGQSVYLGDLSDIRNCRRLIIDNHDGGKVIFVRNPTGSIPTFTSETLEYIDVSGADTHLLTDMSGMFNDSPNLKRIVGLENFDTSHVQSFELMFGLDPQLMDIGDLSKWDVSKVENFNEMFQWDKNLTNIGNLDNWDVSQAKSFEMMFMGTKKLESIGSLKDWQVKNVTDMAGMFLLSSIVGVDMSNWDVSSLRDVSYMFAYNYNPRFTNLELPNFSKAKLESWLQAFLDDNYLENINISGWDFVDDLNNNKDFHDAGDGADNLFDKWLSTSGVNGLTVNTIGAKWPSDLDLMPKNSDFDYNPKYGVTDSGINRFSSFEGLEEYIKDIKYIKKPTPLVVLTDNQILLGYNKQRSESNRPNEITLVDKNGKVIGQYQMPIFYTSIDDIKKQISQYEDEFTQNYRKQNNDPKATFTFTLVDPETHQELTKKQIENLTPAQWVMATYLVRQNAKATVTYIDQTTGKTLTVRTLKGHTLEDTGYNTASDIKHYVDNGYDLVGDTSKGAEIIFDDDDAADQAYTVTLKHGTVTVTPSDNVTEGNPINKDANGAKWPAGATKSVLQHDVKRNVTYVIANGKQTAPASVNDSLHYEAAATVDKVTGQVVKTVWSNAQDFKDVATPAVKGYTADKQNVSDKNIAHDHADIKEVVTYAPDAQKATVTYIDQTTGKTLTVRTLKGHTLEDTGYNTASDIKHYVDNGYDLVGDTSKGAEIIFDDDDAADQAYTVTLKHGTVTVTPSDNVTEGNPINKDANGAKWPAGATKSVLQHDVKRNVTYVIANGKQTAPASVNDSLHYEAAATVDKVTGQVVKTVWSNAQDFKDVATPAVKGYTADKQNVSDKNIAHDHADIKEVVTYAPDAQKATVTYIDQTTGKTLTVRTLKGHTLEDTGYNTASDIKHYVDNGYDLVGDTSKGAEIIFDDDDAADQAYTVTLKHGTVTVTPSDNVTEGNPINKDANGAKWPAGATKSVLQHDVKRNVTYVIANGKQTAPASVNDSLHYEAAATVDKVTGQVVKTVWSNAQDFKDVATPAVKGYTADKQNVSDKNIAHDHADIKEVVTYAPDAQKATVTYIDQTTGKTLTVRTLKGHTLEDTGYNTASDIKHYVDNGYDLVGDTSKGAEIIFDDDDAADQAYTVTLKHAESSASSSAESSASSSAESSASSSAESSASSSAESSASSSAESSASSSAESSASSSAESSASSSAESSASSSAESSAISSAESSASSSAESSASSSAESSASSSAESSASSSAESSASSSAESSASSSAESSASSLAESSASSSAESSASSSAESSASSSAESSASSSAESSASSSAESSASSSAESSASSSAESSASSSAESSASSSAESSASSSAESSASSSAESSASSSAESSASSSAESSASSSAESSASSSAESSASSSAESSASSSAESSASSSAINTDNIANNATSNVSDGHHVTASRSNVQAGAVNANKKLPQTGNNNEGSLFALAMLVLSTCFGLGLRKKRD